MKLTKKLSAVVTGGASGLGKACIEMLKNAGLQVRAWDLQGEGDKEVISCDVSSEASVLAALETTIASIGIPRICINCAGIAPAKRMINKEGLPMPLEDFERVITINLTGSFNVMRLVAGAMKDLPLLAEERGVFINTASVAAFEGQIGQIAYSASKGGITALTLPAARELAAMAIRVNTIAPGIMATPLLLNMPQEVQASLAANVTFPKRLGLPEEFAATAKYIIETAYVNGEVIRLDGGIRMQAR